MMFAHSSFAADAGIPTKRELKEAAKAFRRGAEFMQKERVADALPHFELAAQLAPTRREYLVSREAARQQLVFEHVRKGDAALAAGARMLAASEFSRAIALDANHGYALSRLQEATAAPAPAPAPALRLVAQFDEVELQPQPDKAEFRIRGDSRALFEAIAKRFGVSVEFDDSFQSRRVRFEVDGVDFQTAMAVASKMTRTFWVPLNEKRMLVVADNQQNRQQFERMSLRTFHLAEVTSPQELTEAANLLRTIFDFRLVSPNPSRNLLTVRAPKPMLDAATRVLESLRNPRPQIMLELKAYEVNHSALRSLGVDLPLQFRIFHVNTELRNLSGSTPNLQDLINRLIAAGGLNQADLSQLAGLLAQLQGSPNSLIGQPIATFGGGQSRFGVVVPGLTARAEFNQSWLRSSQSVMIRAGENEAATFRNGVRYPVLNATFAPLQNTRELQQSVRTGAFQTAFPSFTYEELGITVKATPRVNGTESVTLRLELQVKALGGISFNAVPVITNREYNGTVTLKEGHAAVLMGSLNVSEQRSMRGVPGFGSIPLLNRLTGSENAQSSDSQLLIVVIPHIIRAPEGRGVEEWIAR